MKISHKLKLLTLFLLALQAFTMPAFAQYLEYWEVTSFDSQIIIGREGGIEIKEEIVADFGNEAHRGILRTIPYRFSGRTPLSTRYTPITFHSATNQDGKSWNTETYKSNGIYNIEMRTDNNIANNLINTFKIHYTMKNVINEFEEHDELYLNINGTDWPVNTKKLTATVTLPEPLERSEIDVKCFTGRTYESKTDCTWKFEDNIHIKFQATKPLLAYENMTVVIGMPSRLITPAPPTANEWLLKILLTILIFNAPFVAIIMFALWYKKGRDEKTIKDTVIPHYHAPAGLKPTEVGTLIDEKITARDMTATIIDYAIKGHIKIHEIKKDNLLFKSNDYKLELIKPYKTTTKFESLILEGIFPLNEAGESTILSTLENNFYKKIPDIKKAVNKKLIQDGYFPHNPNTIRSIYSIIGGFLAIGSFNVMGFMPLLGINILASGALIGGIGQFMPRKTKKGTETYYQLKGLYEYIKTAEKDRLKFQEKNNIFFEKLLPYAMAFGLTEKWTKAFAGLIKTPPTWYVSSGNDFDFLSFNRGLNRFHSSFTTSATKAPSSSAAGGSSGFSGGFSGGGFGGGGGRGL